MNYIGNYRTAVSIGAICRLELAIPLPALPICAPNVGSIDNVARGVTVPADLFQCKDCGLLQLRAVVDPSYHYSDYRYETGISLGLSKHFRELAAHVLASQNIADGAFVVEAGSNDGTLLRHFKDLGCRVTGIDPAEAIAARATASGIPTRPCFFTREVAEQIKAEEGPAQVVLCNNALANIDDLDEFLTGVDSLLDDNGVFVFETQYALDVVEKMLVDVIYHEHISYFSVKPCACSSNGPDIGS